MLFICFSKFVLVSCYQSNCLNGTKKKKYNWNTKYTIQHCIELSQTNKCIQYKIHDTKSCELPNYLEQEIKSLFLSIIISSHEKQMQLNSII